MCFIHIYIYIYIYRERDVFPVLCCLVIVAVLLPLVVAGAAPASGTAACLQYMFMHTCLNQCNLRKSAQHIARSQVLTIIILTIPYVVHFAALAGVPQGRLRARQCGEGLDEHCYYHYSYRYYYDCYDYYYYYHYYYYYCLYSTIITITIIIITITGPGW